MDIEPRIVAGTGALALVPIGVYAAFSGELTAMTAALTVVGVCLIVGSLMLMFSPVTHGTDPAH